MLSQQVERKVKLYICEEFPVEFVYNLNVKCFVAVDVVHDDVHEHVIVPLPNVPVFSLVASI